MAEPATRSGTLTAEDLPYLRPEEERSELVAGSLVREPPPGVEHGWAAADVVALLHPFVREHRLGRVSGEAGYVLASDPDTVRCPDASFVSAGRLAAATWKGPYLVGAPDLAVEVISPGDRASEVAAKAEEYLAAGAQAVWVLDPRRQTVTIHLPGREPQTLGRMDVLEGDPYLPGLRLRVAELLASQT
jgi:Uma2 family endonuclease